MKYLLIYVLLVPFNGHDLPTTNIGPVAYKTLSACQKAIDIIKNVPNTKVHQAYCLEAR